MSHDDERAGRDPAPAVSRSIRLLQSLAASREPMTLTMLASVLGAAKSSTANLCMALEAGGMIRRVALGYQLGPTLATLGGAYTAQFNQVREFYGVVETSPVLVSEVVQVAMLDGADALYLARHEGPRAVRIGTPLGSRLPAVLSATGRALLLRYDDEDVAARVGDGPFPNLTGRGVRDLAELQDKLRTSRERGWTLDEGESFQGVYGVAVPLPAWAPGDPDLALGVALPAGEATFERVTRVAGALTEAARSLTNPFSEAARR